MISKTGLQIVFELRVPQVPALSLSNGRHIISHSPQSPLVSKPMTLFENAYNEAIGLVQKFQEHRGQFMAHKYLEAELHPELLGAFWTALGWDDRKKL